MTTWYERAEREIEEDLEQGHIDGKGYQQRMRELMWELRESAESAADRAYDDVMDN